MSSSKRTLIGLTFIVSMFLVTTFVIVSARETASQEPSQTTPAGAQTLPTALPNGPVQVVRFSLYDAGIVPNRAYARPGLVTIAMEDLSGGKTGLVIERDENDQARVIAGEVLRKKDSRNGRQVLSLEVGHYQLYVGDHSENRAELIVEP